MDTMKQSLFITAAGMRAQVTRLRTVSQNLANAETTPLTPQGDPYRRQTIHFRNRLDRELGVELVQVERIGKDRSDFRLVYEPGHPAADENGYVKYPNVNALIEVNDYRQASRSYEAMLNSYRITRGMMTKTIDMLR